MAETIHTESGIDAQKSEILHLLKAVSDPEIPVLNVVDLGIIRNIKRNGQSLEVDISPTYTGCPAMEVIERDVSNFLTEKGFAPVTVNRVLKPAWTTDWITSEGRRKLKEYGIAPPESAQADKRSLMGESGLVTCPYCSNRNTQLQSPFGSTPCKALYLCKDCMEPFDYFKCH